MLALGKPKDMNPTEEDLAALDRKRVLVALEATRAVCATLESTLVHLGACSSVHQRQRHRQHRPTLTSHPRPSETEGVVQLLGDLALFTHRANERLTKVDERLSEGIREPPRTGNDKVGCGGGGLSKWVGEGIEAAAIAAAATAVTVAAAAATTCHHR